MNIYSNETLGITIAINLSQVRFIELIHNGKYIVRISFISDFNKDIEFPNLSDAVECIEELSNE